MFIRVWETLRGLILYKYPFKGLSKRVERKKKDEIFMVFKSWKTVLFSSIHKSQKEKELALLFRSPCQRTRAAYHELEAGRLDDLDPQTTQKSKGYIYFSCMWMI